MKNRLCFFICCLSLYVPFTYAEILPLNDALRATYTACVGIDDELADLKKMAGINTAVTAVGTGLGAGATVVGIIKAQKDELREELDKKLRDLRNMSDKEFLQFLADISNYKQYKDMLDKEEKANKESKKLGNWRTGLMVGNTATSVAGAIIAGNNKVDDDLQTQIDNCKLSVKNLKDSIMQAKFNGEDVTVVLPTGETQITVLSVEASDINKIENAKKI